MAYNNLDYKKLTKLLSVLIKKYPFMGVYPVGKSHLGKDILCISFGKGEKKIFLNGAHHSLEWITSSLLLSFSFDYAKSLKEENSFLNKNIIDLYNKVTFYVVPMVNPDGVDFVINGISKNNEKYEFVKSILNGKNIKKVWQANANGVDLNHNYDALFDEGKKIEKEYGILSANYTRYSGEKPFSEPETKAIKNLFEKEKFDLSVAFHTQGEVIYWDFMGKSPYKNMAQKLSVASGYALDETEGIASYTGFKDWVIDKFNLPSFTVEAGYGKNPLPYSAFGKIRKENYALISECVNLI